MERVLVSACLLGEPVRYDGRAATSAHPVLQRWLQEGRVVRVCPEIAGGLGTPRPRAERQGVHVITEAGDDVTPAFVRGAELACAAAQAHGVRVAVLKDGSPSCGSTEIADGTFSGRRTGGAGVTTAMLRREGVRVFSEQQLDEAAAYLAALETS